MSADELVVCLRGSHACNIARQVCAGLALSFGATLGVHAFKRAKQWRLALESAETDEANNELCQKHLGRPTYCLKLLSCAGPANEDMGDGVRSSAPLRGLTSVRPLCLAAAQQCPGPMPTLQLSEAVALAGWLVNELVDDHDILQISRRQSQIADGERGS